MAFYKLDGLNFRLEQRTVTDNEFALERLPNDEWLKEHINLAEDLSKIDAEVEAAKATLEKFSPRSLTEIYCPDVEEDFDDFVREESEARDALVSPFHLEYRRAVSIFGRCMLLAADEKNVTYVTDIYHADEFTSPPFDHNLSELFYKLFGNIPEFSTSNSGDQATGLIVVSSEAEMDHDGFVKATAIVPVGSYFIRGSFDGHHILKSVNAAKKIAEANSNGDIEFVKQINTL